MVIEPDFSCYPEGRYHRALATMRLIDDANAPLLHRSEVQRTAPGTAATDSRSPAKLGIIPGKHYTIVLLAKKQ